MSAEIDERTVELIAERVMESLRDELESIVAELARANGSARPLTVEEVADRFGVARSTVYAHWREWGGYKLGQNDKAPIRFDSSRLPTTPPAADMRSDGPSGKRRKRRDLVADTPRFEQPLTGFEGHDA
jgi:transposase-like protein